MYLQTLKRKGVFEGGSEIGGGVCVRKGATAPDITKHLGGYIRIAAASIDQVKSLLAGHPHFEAGGHKADLAKRLDHVRFQGKPDLAPT